MTLKESINLLKENGFDVYSNALTEPSKFGRAEHVIEYSQYIADENKWIDDTITVWLTPEELDDEDRIREIVSDAIGNIAMDDSIEITDVH